MDRVDLTREHGVDRQRRWTSGHALGWSARVIEVGQLADGRWFADRYGYLVAQEDGTAGAHVFSADERGRTLALRLARRWMSDGDWTADE